MDPATTYPEAVTTRILEVLTQSGHTINSIAQRIGMTRNTFNRRIAGHSFTLTEVSKIATALGVEVEQLTAPRRAA